MTLVPFPVARHIDEEFWLQGPETNRYAPQKNKGTDGMARDAPI